MVKIHFKDYIFLSAFLTKERGEVNDKVTSCYVSLKTAVANKRLNETTEVVGDVEERDVTHLLSGPSLQSDFSSNFTACRLINSQIRVFTIV